MRNLGTHSLICLILIIVPLCRGVLGEESTTASSSQTTVPPRTSLRLPIDEPSERPLLPLANFAIDRYRYCKQNIADYSCIVVRQERVNGQLGPHEFIEARVRNRRSENGKVVAPFSVYLKFLKPAKVQGREVLYVEGKNDGDMFVRNGGQRFAHVTTRLKPTSPLAMSENRYPITEFGIENLIRRLAVAAKEHVDARCTVKFVDDAKLNKRPCRQIILVNEDRSQKLPFREVRVFIDHELQVPVHYEAYDWPHTPEGKPRLLERYTYLNVKINNGFTDEDFDPNNPNINVK